MHFFICYYSSWISLCNTWCLTRCCSTLNDFLHPGKTQWKFLTDKWVLMCCLSLIWLLNCMLQPLKMHGKSTPFFLNLAFITVKFPSSPEYMLSSSSSEWTRSGWICVYFDACLMSSFTENSNDDSSYNTRLISYFSKLNCLMSFLMSFRSICEI